MLCKILGIRLTRGFLTCQNLPCESLTKDKQGQERTQGFWVDHYHSVTSISMHRYPVALPLMTQSEKVACMKSCLPFQAVTYPCVIKHYSVPEICTLRILWPWTWCTAIVILISLVIRSICCCSESRLRTTFDRLPYCCCLYIWRLHSDRVILWKGKWTEQAFDGHNAHDMVINQRKRYLRLAWVHSYERD